MSLCSLSAAQCARETEHKSGRLSLARLHLGQKILSPQTSSKSRPHSRQHRSRAPSSLEFLLWYYLVKELPHKYRELSENRPDRRVPASDLVKPTQHRQLSRRPR